MDGRRNWRVSCRDFEFDRNDFSFFRYKEKTIGVAKVDWSLIADREDNSNHINKSLVAFYRGLVRLRKSNRAFFTTNLTFLHEDFDAKVLVYQRWYVTNEKILNRHRIFL